MIFIIMWQTKNLVKKTKGPLRWPNLNQIDHFDLTLDQINHINIDLIYLFIYL
jgi:hypothetical protein